MNQVSPLPINFLSGSSSNLTAATSSGGNEGGAQPFGQYFKVLSEGEGSIDSSVTTYTSWQQFSEELNALAEELGMDLTQLFQGLTSEWQDLSDGQGAALPLELVSVDPETLLEQFNAVLGEMGLQAQVSDAQGIELAPIVDENGLLTSELNDLDLERLQTALASLYHVATSEYPSSDAAPIAAANAVDLASLQSSGERQSRMILSGKGPEYTGQLSVASEMASPVAQEKAAYNSTVLASGDRVGAGQPSTDVQGEGLRPTLNAGNSEAARSTHGALGTQDTVQSENDINFKSFIESSGLNGSASESLEELMVGKVGEASNGKALDAQSRMQAANLRHYSTSVNVPVSDEVWADEMSQKIVWMTGRNIQAAEIHLNPAELGPVEVKISVQNDQASVSFNVQHASVRELLESNVYRLREMMGENGVELSDVNVGQEQEQSAFGDTSEQQAANDQFEGDVENGDGDVDESTTVQVTASDSLVDYYA